MKPNQTCCEKCMNITHKELGDWTPIHYTCSNPSCLCHTRPDISKKDEGGKAVGIVNCGHIKDGVCSKCQEFLGELVSPTPAASEVLQQERLLASLPTSEGEKTCLCGGGDSPLAVKEPAVHSEVGCFPAQPPEKVSEGECEHPGGYTKDGYDICGECGKRVGGNGIATYPFDKTSPHPAPKGDWKGVDLGEDVRCGYCDKQLCFCDFRKPKPKGDWKDKDKVDSILNNLQRYTTTLGADGWDFYSARKEISQILADREKESEEKWEEYADKRFDVGYAKGKVDGIEQGLEREKEAYEKGSVELAEGRAEAYQQGFADAKNNKQPTLSHYDH